MNYDNNIDASVGYSSLPNIEQRTSDIDTNHLTVSESILRLEAFIKQAVEKNYKGSKLVNAAKENNINRSLPSLLKYIYAYRKNGISALVRKERKDSGDLKTFSPMVIQKLQDCYSESLHMKLAYEDTHRWLRMFCIKFIPVSSPPSPFEGEGQGVRSSSRTTNNEQPTTNFSPGDYVSPDGEVITIGSYRSATRYLSSFKQHAGDQLYYKRFGLSNYRLHRQKKMTLDYSALLPNASWSLDNKQLDCYIMSDDLKAIYRPWLSGVYDASTRRYTFELSKSPDSESVCNAVVNAITQWGKPDEIVTDRGKDYLSERVRSFLESVSIKVRNTEARKANSKMIESMHNIIDQKTKNFIGYTGNKYKDCPEQTKQLLKSCTNIKNIQEIYESYSNNTSPLYERGVPEGGGVSHSSSFPKSSLGTSPEQLNLRNNYTAKALASKNRFMTESELLDRLNLVFTEYEHSIQGGLKSDKVGRKVYDLNCADELINSLGEKINTPEGRYKYHCEKGFVPVVVDQTVLAFLAMSTAVRIVGMQGIQFKDRIQKYFSPKLKTVIGQRVIVKFTKCNDCYLYVFTSDEIQNITNTADLKNLRLTNEQKYRDILLKMKFVCVAQKQASIEYHDQTFKDTLKKQREEESMLKIASGIHHMTGLESNIIEINNDINESLKPKSTKKLKSLWD